MRAGIVVVILAGTLFSIKNPLLVDPLIVTPEAVDPLRYISPDATVIGAVTAVVVTFGVTKVYGV